MKLTVCVLLFSFASSILAFPIPSLERMVPIFTAFQFEGSGQKRLVKLHELLREKNLSPQVFVELDSAAMDELLKPLWTDAEVIHSN